MSRLPVYSLVALSILSAVVVIAAEQLEWSGGVSDIAGAVVSGAVVGAALLWYEEVLQKRRDDREAELAREQGDRDEWVAFILQLGLQEDLSEIKLVDRDLHGVFLARKVLRNADFSGSNLRDAYFAHSQLSGTLFRGTDLRGTRMYKADMASCDFESADLRGAALPQATLIESSFKSADLQSADLYGADLTGSDFRGANLKDANLLDANIEGITVDHGTVWPSGTIPRPLGVDRDRSL